MRFLFALVVLLALAGCGGGGDGGDSATTAADPPETAAVDTAGNDEATKRYLEQGDAICADVQRELAPIIRRIARIQGSQQNVSRAEFYRRAADLWADQIEIAERFQREFQALDPPADEEERHAALIASLDESLQLSRTIHAAVSEQREPPPEVVTRYRDAVVEGNTLAQQAGFDVCGATGSR